MRVVSVFLRHRPLIAGTGLLALAGLLAAGLDEDGGPGPSAEHHQAHDRVAGDGGAIAGDLDLGLEALGGTHEAGRGASVQALAVDDGQLLRQGASGLCGTLHATHLAAIRLSRQAPRWRH